MSGRPIVLPGLPEGTEFIAGENRHFKKVCGTVTAYLPGQVREAQRAAVEADRKGIVVTDEDVEAGVRAYEQVGPAYRGAVRAALESFAARKRGET